MANQPTGGVILYAEDNENDALLMQIAFRKARLSHLFRLVKNGQEAIDYLSGNGVFADRNTYPLPTLLVLDLDLPMISGFGVLRWVRCHPKLHDLPVMIFSSSVHQDEKLKAIKLGVIDFIQKPDSGEQFKQALDRFRGYRM